MSVTENYISLQDCKVVLPHPRERIRPLLPRKELLMWWLCSAGILILAVPTSGESFSRSLQYPFTAAIVPAVLLFGLFNLAVYMIPIYRRHAAPFYLDRDVIAEPVGHRHTLHYWDELTNIGLAYERGPNPMLTLEFDDKSHRAVLLPELTESELLEFRDIIAAVRSERGLPSPPKKAASEAGNTGKHDG
ncbi:hypothetical protein [Cucumibacter marinus]|uniref:hypothetical protein n=1 Tax=Cucumibacter marinus TaxID=1121252 RepID=UPI0012DDE64A|nr:hypothetical protein [Cucumibacter marinus]